MSTTVPPRDGDALAGQSPSSAVLTDEQALQRVFRENFAACVADARAQLGDAAGMAPRVIETAFVRLWEDRAKVQTPEQLKEILSQEVHHGVARAMSRRAAAHRFGGGKESAAKTGAATGTIDADATWEHIQRGIHGGEHSAGALAAAAETSRKDAAHHMAQVTKERSWVVPVAVGVGALVLSVAGVIFFNRLGQADAISMAVNSPTAHPVASGAGQMGSMSLDDGTKVRMGAETRLSVPDQFNKKIRAVKVDGAAVFDVAPNNPMQFTAVARKVQMTATGTSFFVSSYPQDSAVVVQVREGTVSVRSGKTVQPLAAGKALIIVGTAEPRAPTADELETAVGWTEGRVAMVDRQLRDVLPFLLRWYNSDVKVPDLPLLDRKITFHSHLDSLKTTLAQIEQSGNLKFGYEGETKVFRDAGSAKGSAAKAGAKAAPAKAAPAKGKKKK